MGYGGLVLRRLPPLHATEARVALVLRPAPTAATELPSGRSSRAMVTARATVEAIDVKKRLGDARKPDGSSVTLEVGAEVRNLPLFPRRSLRMIRQNSTEG